MKKEITIKAVIFTKDNGIDNILGEDFINEFATPRELYDFCYRQKDAGTINNFFMLESEPLAGTCYADYTGNTADELCAGGNFAQPKYIGLGADHKDYVLEPLNKEMGW
tara:strand:- start:776 stop:1102 length:327 start_codon:yes stop_codon:yes gene_type:complete